jgi:HTH-type transcriptional regulator/antitoxin HigA
MPRENKTAQRGLDSDYLALIRAFPLRPLRTAAEYQAALVILDRLAIRDEETLAPGERDYLDALTLFVERYDSDHAPQAQQSPLDMLRGLMENRGMTVSALGTVLKSKGVASEILAGKRRLNLTHMRRLADFFRVDPAVFMPGRQTLKKPA